MFCSKCGCENAFDAPYCERCGSPLGDGLTSGADETVGMLGPYMLKGELGRGAMARVWRAWDPNLEREVAIKEPMFDERLGEAALEEMGRRFVKEGKTAARLQHPGIVTIYAADVYDGRPAIVMELLGATLADILEHEGKLSPEAALDALDQLLDAVGYAHAAGVVHRDIKPDNIFVSGDGRVKLADFGIAHVDDGKATRATMVGTVLGTPGYMSPEQVKGDKVDSRSDLFSIGVIGYELLSGRNPFGSGDGSDSTALLYRIVHEPAGELPEACAIGLPADLRPAIMAALSKNPDDRPQTAAAFKAMLHGEAQGEDRLRSAPQPVMRKNPKWIPYAVVAAACLVAIAFLGANAFSGSNGCSSAPAPAPTSSATSVAGLNPTADAPVAKSSVDDYSWEELSAISALIAAADGDLQAAQIAADYNLCDTDGKLDGTQKKEITLADGTTVAAQIIGFNHDERQDGGTAGITFLLDECVDQRPMNASGSSDGGWKGSDLRAWLNDGFMDELPEDLQDVIVSVEKATNAVGKTPYADGVIEEISDYLWLPSARELCGPINWATGKKAKAGANKILNAEGEIYSLYDDLRVNGDGSNSILKRTTDAGDKAKWWLRSVRSSEPGCFYYVDGQGKPHCYDGLADSSLGVVPGFCI